MSEVLDQAEVALSAGFDATRLAAAAGVRFVAPPARPLAQAVAGEEAGSTHASAWQAAGITGTGVKVTDAVPL